MSEKVLKISPKDVSASRPRRYPKSEEFLSYVELWGGKAASKKGGGRPEPPRDPREAARQEAEAILRQAHAEAARVEEEARERGYAKGEEEGRAAGEQEYRQRIEQLDALLKELQTDREHLLHRYEQEILTLVTAMVERLVHHEVSVNPLVIKACLKEAMNFVVQNSLVRVHLHPDDLQRVKEATLVDPTFFSQAGQVQLVEDPLISQGGCRLSGGFGEVDATLETRRERLLSAVEQAFLAALAAGGDRGEENPPAESS